MLARMAALFVVTLMMLAGCKGKPTLVGDWSGSLTVQGISVAMNLHFAEDGGVSITQSAAGQSTTQKGKFEAMEKSFTVTVDSMESATLDKSMLEAANTALKNKPQKVTFTLEWKDDDNISILQEGAMPPLNQAIPLKRKK